MTAAADPSGEARRRAGALVDARQFDAARSEIARAFAEDPDDAAAFHVLALLEQGLGRYDDALAAIDRAAALGLAPEPVLNRRMTVLYYARRFREAVGVAEELLRLAPQHVQAHIMLAQMLGGEGRQDYPRARAHGEHAVALAPENDHAHYALASVLGSTDGRRGARAALPHLEQAVRLAPEDVANLNALGLGELTLGRTRRALRSFATALAIDPGCEPAAFNVPLAMYGLARRAGAVVTLLFVVGAALGVGLAPRDATASAGPSPGAGPLAHVVAVVVVLVVAAAVVAWVRASTPTSLRPAAARAWRADRVLLPVSACSATQVVLAAVMVALPVTNGVHVTPLLLVGLAAGVTATLLSQGRTARYGRDRERERTELWRPRVGPGIPDGGPATRGAGGQA